MAIDALQDMLGSGSDIGDRLVANNFDIGCLRPWKGKDGRTYMCTIKDGKPTVTLCNAASTLSYDNYKFFDGVIQQVLRDRMVAMADLRARVPEFRINNAMAYTTIQSQTMSDITRATISMSPTRRSERDRPVMDTTLFPLPIIHKDFDYDIRELAISQRGDVPLDSNTARMAAVQVAEEIERMLIGAVSAFSSGGGTIYGYLTNTTNATKTDMTVPTGSNNTTVVNDILTLRQLLINNRHRGPYMIYVNSQWSAVLDTDYSTAKGDNTLRQRILALDNIAGIKTLDFLPTTHWNLLMVELDQMTVEPVIGMEAQTVQWESMGGLMKHWKVMAMIYGRIRSDTDSHSGIGVGTTVAA